MKALWDKLTSLPGSLTADPAYGQAIGSSGSTTIGGAGAAGQAMGTSQQQIQQQLQGAAQTLFGHTLTSQQIQQMFQGYSVGLSPEEEAEYQQAQKDYATEIKAAKLNIFKKLPTDMRQFIINAITWKEHTGEMDSVIVEKSDRLKELEQKNAYKAMFSSTLQHQSWHSSGVSTGFQAYPPELYDSLFRLPHGVTVEDLKQAHMEATLEEEILNGEEEKT